MGEGKGNVEGSGYVGREEGKSDRRTIKREKSGILYMHNQNEL